MKKLLSSVSIFCMAVLCSGCRAIVVADKLVYQGTFLHKHQEKLMVDSTFTIQLPSYVEPEPVPSVQSYVTGK